MFWYLNKCLTLVFNSRIAKLESLSAKYGKFRALPLRSNVIKSWEICFLVLEIISHIIGLRLYHQLARISVECNFSQRNVTLTNLLLNWCEGFVSHISKSWLPSTQTWKLNLCECIKRNQISLWKENQKRTIFCTAEV